MAVWERKDECYVSFNLAGNNNSTPIHSMMKMYRSSGIRAKEHGRNENGKAVLMWLCGEEKISATFSLKGSSHMCSVMMYRSSGVSVKEDGSNENGKAVLVWLCGGEKISAMFSLSDSSRKHSVMKIYKNSEISVKEHGSSENVVAVWGRK